MADQPIKTANGNGTTDIHTDSNGASSSRPVSLRSNNEPLSPVNTHPSRRVTIRSERSLPRKTGTLLDGEHREPQTFGSQIAALPGYLKLVLFATKINVLLIFIPLGIIADLLHWSDVTVFILNFIAIIPLAKRKYASLFRMKVAMSWVFFFFLVYCCTDIAMCQGQVQGKGVVWLLIGR